MMRKMWRASLAVVAALAPATVQAQPFVTARGAIIVDADSGAVIWEYNADEPLPPASTTKVMTAVLALQSHRLDQQFPVSANASATPPSKIGLRPGQSVALRDLLYAVLLKSANDAAVVVAEGVSGSEFGFADQMNLKARVVGATTTNFVNPHGLTEYGHVSTARDLSRIFRYGLGIPGFREVLRTSSAEVMIDGPNARLATVRSHNRLLNAPDYQVIGKTGYTRLARRCFVGAAGHGSREVVIAILGSGDLWGDARRMLYYGLSPDRPTPALMASATPPPPAAVARAAEPAPPPAGDEPEPAPAVARAAAPQPALDRAARMARARPDDPAFDEEQERAEERGEPDGLDAPPPAVAQGDEPAHRVAPPPPVDDRPDRRPTTEDYAHRDLDRDAEPAAVEERVQPAALGAGTGAPPAADAEEPPAAAIEPTPRPAAAEEPSRERSRPASAIDEQAHPARLIDEELRGEPSSPSGVPDDPQPGAGADHEPAPSVWADSPLRNARDEQPRVQAGRAAPMRETPRETRREPPQPRRIEEEPAQVATRQARPAPARPAQREVRKPAAVARVAREETARPARDDTRSARAETRPARERDTVAARRGTASRAADDRRTPAAEPARVAADARRAREARADRRRGASGREDRGREPVVLARASAQDPRPQRPTARGLETGRGRTTGKTATTARDSRRAADAEVASGSRAGSKYTVQVGPYRDRKAVATARADLAKKGYEARVVGQKLELGNFAERSRADKLASRLRVTGHRATSAAAR